MSEDVLVSGAPSPMSFGTPGSQGMVEPTFGAQRVKLCATEYNDEGFQGGHFRVAVASGALTGVAAGGAVFSTQWKPGANNVYMLLKRIQVAAVITTVFTAAQALDFDVMALRAFTAPDTGGTALTPFTGNNQKNRTAFMNTSQVTDMRMATTAALGAGTKTADASAFGITCLPNTNAIGTGTPLVDLYKEDVAGAYPMMFGNNEGFNIRAVTAMGALGVIKLYVIVEWAEVPGL